MAQLPPLAGLSVPALAVPHSLREPLTSSASPAPARRTQLRSEAAYEQLLPELIALPSAQLLPVDVDVMSAITTVGDALPGMLELCSELEPPASATRARDQPELCQSDLEQLEHYTLALAHAHLLYCGSFSPELDVTLLTAELTKMRDGMLAHAESLAAEGLLDGERLRRIALRSALHSAHRAVAGDVIALCAAFKDHWPQLEDKTPYTLEEQFRLVRLALDLMAALGAPERAPSNAAESCELRQRAFTLFARAYERARCAVQYLRASQGDADVLAPPLREQRAPGSARLRPLLQSACGAAAPPPPARGASLAPRHPAETRG